MTTNLRVSILIQSLSIISCVIVISGCNVLRGHFPETPVAPPLGTESATAQISPTATPFPLEEIRFHFGNEVPFGLRKMVEIPQGVKVVDDPAEADVVFGRVGVKGETSPLGSNWHYVKAAAFPALSIDPERPCTDLLMAQDTYLAFEGVSPSRFGCEQKTISDAADLLDQTAKDASTFALIPFEELNPAWQSIEGEPITNPDITVHFGLSGDPGAIIALEKSGGFSYPETNFDPQRSATVILTGTTALTRGTGRLMDEKGVLYPAEQIGEILRAADLTHISNEISFVKDCSVEKAGMKFCSKPEYFELLKSIGTDLVELTGNHELDYGQSSFLETLELYTANGIPFYGGGKTISEAAQAYKIEINGNRLAFLGCNKVGPVSDLATEDSPGSNPCDIKALREQVAELKKEGYLPIVTFQHMEVCDAQPVPPQRGDFQNAAEAGAVIVSGSQGHCPQVLELYGSSVIHYGLGNLFFDQMDKIERTAFIDRYLFYDNHLISVDPIGIIREDEAQPRLMTAEESRLFAQRFLQREK